MFSLTNEENRPKAWLVNVVFTLLEVVSLVIYGTVGAKMLYKAFTRFDFEGMFRSVEVAIWTLSVVVLVYSVFFLCFKNLRTPYVKGVAVWNLIWVAFNIYELLS